MHISGVYLGYISQVELTRVGTRAYAPRELAAETERNSAPRTVKMLLAQAPPDDYSDNVIMKSPIQSDDTRLY